MLDILYDLLADLSDRPFIRAYENGREPEKPFFVYDLKFEKTPEHLHYSTVNGQGEQQIKTHIDAVLELHYLGENSLDVLRTVCMKLSTSYFRDKWTEQGVALVQIGSITHLAYLDEQQKYQDRAVVEINIRYTAMITDILSIIEQVKMTSQIGSHSDTTKLGATNNGKN